MNLLPNKPWWHFMLVNYPRVLWWAPVHIFNSQSAEAIIERCKEQVQGDLEVLGGEPDGEKNAEKILSWFILAVVVSVFNHKKKWTHCFLYACRNFNITHISGHALHIFHYSFKKLRKQQKDFKLQSFNDGYIKILKLLFKSFSQIFWSFHLSGRPL